ncbi:hypothetical protein H4R21_005026, partial [Coemansia helicoidea]
QACRRQQPRGQGPVLHRPRGLPEQRVPVVRDQARRQLFEAGGQVPDARRASCGRRRQPHPNPGGPWGRPGCACRHAGQGPAEAQRDERDPDQGHCHGDHAAPDGGHQRGHWHVDQRDAPQRDDNRGPGRPGAGAARPGV